VSAIKAQAIPLDHVMHVAKGKASDASNKDDEEVPSHEPNGCLNDAPCSSCTRHGASITSRVGRRCCRTSRTSRTTRRSREPKLR
jgi:hypothetical protein